MRILWSKRVITITLIIAVLYVLATMYLMNASLVQDAIFGVHSPGYARDLLIALLAGMWTAMSGMSLALLVSVALLTGANVSIILSQIQANRVSGKVSFTAGGSSLLGMIGVGCASCGLPPLALLGLGGVAAYLPFQGVEVSLLSIALLSFSLFLLMKERKIVCALPAANKTQERIKNEGEDQVLRAIL